jgi:hypothetical protein
MLVLKMWIWDDYKFIMVFSLLLLQQNKAFQPFTPTCTSKELGNPTPEAHGADTNSMATSAFIRSDLIPVSTEKRTLWTESSRFGTRMAKPAALSRFCTSGRDIRSTGALDRACHCI